MAIGSASMVWHVLFILSYTWRKRRREFSSVNDPMVAGTGKQAAYKLKGSLRRDP